MRSVGLSFLLLGTLAFLFPAYDSWIAAINLKPNENIYLGGIFVACGALALGFSRLRRT